VLVDGARHQLDLIRAEPPAAASTSTSWSTSSTSSNTWGRRPGASTPRRRPAAEPWVADHALEILAGEVDATSPRSASRPPTPASHPRRKGIDTCIGYLTAKRAFLGYDSALAAGWPIAVAGRHRRVARHRIWLVASGCGSRRWRQQRRRCCLQVRVTSGEVGCA
jgi:hypothetical protein